MRIISHHNQHHLRTEYVHRHSPVLVQVDMSSDIMSRPVDGDIKIWWWSTRCPENVGPGRVIFWIMRKNILENLGISFPCWNTQTTYWRWIHSILLRFFCIYHDETLKWLKNGQCIHSDMNQKTDLFMQWPKLKNPFSKEIAAKGRPIHNECMFWSCSKHDMDLEAEFQSLPKQRGMAELRTRSAGGFRVSIYCTRTKGKRSILINCMQEFENHHKSYVMNVLIVTDKPFAKIAVDGIRTINGTGGRHDVVTSWKLYGTDHPPYPKFMPLLSVPTNHPWSSRAAPIWRLLSVPEYG